MKNLITRIVILIVIIFPSCRTTFDQTLLRPTEKQIEPLLPKLTLQEKSSEIRYSEGNQVTTNSKMYTLFERELENICEYNGDPSGNIEPILILCEASYGIFGFISTLTCYIPCFVGMPVSNRNLQLEVEFIISDTNGDRVWRKSYYKECKILYGLYYNRTKREDEEMVKLFKDMISELKDDIHSDVDSIKGKL